jgi:hypothetical protein
MTQGIKISKLNPDTDMDTIMGIQNNIDDNLYSMWKIANGDGPGGSGGGSKHASFKTSYKGPSMAEALGYQKKATLSFKGITGGTNDTGKATTEKPRKRIGTL